MREFSSVGTLVVQSLKSIPEALPSVEAEIRELAHPYLAVLVHKRCKTCGAESADPFADKRWLAELEKHADNWSTPCADAAEHARLVETTESSRTSNDGWP